MAGGRGDAHGRRRSPRPSARDLLRQLGLPHLESCGRGWMQPWPTPKAPLPKTNKLLKRKRTSAFEFTINETKTYVVGG